MEVGNGRRICRENSPERERGKSQSSRRSVIRPSFRKVQVVYYLSRNGQLEHPHYMEVTHLAHQQLRLKDVIDRLTILRGRGMPSLYSWSCKRSYKNGYVWNDLAENDFICPSEGAEYVLKGSEIIEGSTEKFQQLHITESPQLRNTCQQIQESNFLPKRKSVGSKRHTEPEIVQNNVHYLDENIEEEYEEKSSYTSSTTPNSTCSRGVCTDDQNELIQPITRKNPTELTHTNSLSPPSAVSSSLSDKPINNEITNTSKRFEDGDPVASESLLGRNSVLFQLISCGGSVSFRGKNEPTIVKQPPPSPPCTVVVARKSSSSSSASFHKAVLCKVAAKNLDVNEVEEIKYMSENPRFGNLQSEEKEYFSGSIVESMMTEERTAQVEPQLKKSSSYNEERSSKAGLREITAEAEDEQLKKEKAVKGKCIPRKKSSSKQSKK
ncbi:PREDICTED: protein UPSTREAM OF FLC [Nicotiana attenuata]|uniref:Protein upstream of flc n=1 Tax=Nicotiana attenuata TaxID=49451 RepID=A0A314KTH9_NICAT|nr:PREDICTED: protein UPSTREAM OF FLC [Nicotiana attenuata]OIT32535.1 protein upstream of flc [Nicotiana attenuata]